MDTPTDQSSVIYEKAIRKYREITGETLGVDFFTKIRSVSDLTKEIDERNRAFREFREKRGAIFDVLKAALVPVQLFGNLAAGGASMVFAPSSLVFGAVMQLVDAAKGVSASYDAIQDLMQMLQDFTIRLRTYTQEVISEAISDKLGDIIVTLIEIFALSSKTIQRGRLLKFTRNILLGNDDAIQAAMARLDKLTQVEANLVGAETLTESKRAGRVVDGISVTVNATNATVLETGMTVNQMSAQVHDVQDMLEKLIVSANEKSQDTREDQEALQRVINQVLRPSKVDSAQEWFDKIHKARVPSTGDWVHRDDVFQSWINKETPVIFVSGNPGSGKSFLAANMISFLLKRFPPGLQCSPMISIGYFFFKDDKPETRSFHQALRDLAFQISRNDPEYRKHLGTIEEYEQISTLESAWRLLFGEYFLKNPKIESTVYILLDAVDEALDEERKCFVDLAKQLYSNQSCLQLAIVGRPYISDQLLEGLEAKVPTLHVTKQKNSGDITQYIHVSIKKSLVLRRVSAKLRDEIIEKLSARAEGMFLWVNLMLQELAKKRNETSIRRALDQAPKGLKEMLRHVLATFSERSNEEELEYLNETLLWVTCANQPWRLAEIEAVLRLKSPEGDGMIDLEGALRRQWASFFSLDREDGLTTAELEDGSADLDAFDWRTEEEKQDEYESPEEDYFMAFNSKKDTTTVTFCHASIGDFFRDELEGKVSATGGHIGVGVNYNEAKVHILLTYLRLITNPDFATKADDSGRMLRHAAQHWGDHLLTTFPSKGSTEDRREIAKMLLTAFRSEESMSNWLGGNDWALSTAIIKAVRQWWQEQDVQEFLSPEEKEFISTTVEEPANLLKPMVMFCIKRWLWEDLPSPAPMVSIVRRYQMLVKGEEVQDDNRNLTAEEVVEAAEFGGFEKTSQWFQQCAIALRESGCHEEALQYFEKAMELNPDNWRTLHELAQTYREQDDWQKSIELWERARLSLLTTIAEAPDNVPLKGHLHECLERMAQIYEEQEDREKRFEAVQEAYQYAPSCWTCVYALLEYHNDNCAYEVSMNLLKSLADSPAPEEDFSELTRFLLANVFDVDGKSRLAADAASATNDLDFVLESLQTAARVARTASRTLIAAEVDMAIARIYDEILFDHLKAIRCWEKIMDTYSSSSAGTLIGTIRQLASSRLAQAFLCNAVEVGVGTPEAEESVAKLEKLACESQYHSLGSYAFVPNVYLGIYCHLRGQDERARTLFRPSLQRSVQALLDHNPKNWELSDLQYTLMRAGDFKNAIAIAHRSEQDNGDPWYKCRGPCRRKAPTRDGYSICPICLEGKLCPNCVELVEDAMPKKRCNSQHTRYFVSIPSQLKEIRSGTVQVGGEEMELETWLNQLRKEWTLGTSDPSDSAAGHLGFDGFLLGFVA
ncbi:NACHT and TPR domain protein [Penicillium riverlandense]|uniref:NACHT and TPR domain protein n=1 Tax=Penicillium riverlandense TaxID=1903569 RepID=UPI0025492EF5|nr:NACHT and TPR domain protein [Penicillium riverlandense]KAJ5819255.1 NACHT and TPR domain protein [Penicillium riverlandense]